MDTPSLDRLASQGVRFERAYTTCPLCTPARAGIFSGMHPQVAGAFANNIAPAANVPLWGTIFRSLGHRAAYTGKWHLDGTGYFGDGIPGGGFEPNWWYDGKRYLEDIGPERQQVYLSALTADDLRRAGWGESLTWGHRVADRAIDFLLRVGREPFVLCVSFDEPHGPFVAPPQYWEKFTARDIPRRPNTLAPLGSKPALHHVQRRERGEQTWESYARSATRWFGCNSYIDHEIGRVIDAVDRLHAQDTVIIYTSDHGDQRLSHGLTSKGPMMYEESCNIPLIVRTPGGPRGAVCHQLASHVDLLPTVLDLLGHTIPQSMQGVSLRPMLADPAKSVRSTGLVNFTRFAINHDSWGGFYPVRCMIDDRYKLTINLLDTDEFYDLVEDPYEMGNRIDSPALSAHRDRLHDALLAEMDRIRDPFRSFHWANRAWRTARAPFYAGGERRDRPAGFDFEPRGLEARG